MGEWKARKVVNQDWWTSSSSSSASSPELVACRRFEGNLVHEAMAFVDDKEAYLEAVRRCPDVIEAESPHDMFLQYCDQDMWHAASRLAAFWKIRLDLYGSQRCFAPLVSGLGDADARAWNYNRLNSLPANEDGNTVVYLQMKRKEPNHVMLVKEQCRLFWFVVTTSVTSNYFLAQADVRKEKKELGFRSHRPAWGKLIGLFVWNLDPRVLGCRRGGESAVLSFLEHCHETAICAYPVRHHWCIVNEATWSATCVVKTYLFKFAQRISSWMSTIPTEVHHGTSKQVIAALQQHGFTPDSVPVRCGGRYWLPSDGSAWVETCRRLAQHKSNRVPPRTLLQGMENAAPCSPVHQRVRARDLFGDDLLAMDKEQGKLDPLKPPGGEDTAGIEWRGEYGFAPALSSPVQKDWQVDLTPAFSDGGWDEEPKPRLLVGRSDHASKQQPTQQVPRLPIEPTLTHEASQIYGGIGHPTKANLGQFEAGKNRTTLYDRTSQPFEGNLVHEAMSLVDEKAAYLTAVAKCPAVVMTESPLDRYLEFADNDAREAAKRLAKYWELRLKLFGPKMAFAPLSESLQQKERDFLALGHHSILPPDCSDRPIHFVDRRRWDTAPVRFTALSVRLRSLFVMLQFICDEAWRDKQANSGGEAVLLWLISNEVVTTRDDKETFELVETACSSAMCLRYAVMHFVCIGSNKNEQDEESRRLMSYISLAGRQLSRLSPWLSSLPRENHYGIPGAVLRSLENSGMRAVPTSCGGNWQRMIEWPTMLRERHGLAMPTSQQGTIIARDASIQDTYGSASQQPALHGTETTAGVVQVPDNKRDGLPAALSGSKRPAATYAHEQQTDSSGEIRKSVEFIMEQRKLRRRQRGKLYKRRQRAKDKEYASNVQ